jgi:hypothetical protein
MTTNIVRTELIVTTNDTDYQIPGDWTPAQLVTNYSASISGLANMVHESRVEYREGLGNVRVVTFKPKTGTKGFRPLKGAGAKSVTRRHK